MPFIVLPSNIDYLMSDVRLHIGDTDATRFSDSIIRTALVNGVKMLQRRWSNRYMVYDEELYVADPNPYGYTTYDAYVATSGTAPYVPSGYVMYHLPQGTTFVPSGLHNGDVFRNPAHAFSDTNNARISQEDETPIILMASIVLRRTQLSSSAESFQSWSDGEFSFSNIAASRVQSTMLETDLASLELFFKSRLAGPLRDSFAFNRIPF